MLYYYMRSVKQFLGDFYRGFFEKSERTSRLSIRASIQLLCCALQVQNM